MKRHNRDRARLPSSPSSACGRRPTTLEVMPHPGGRRPSSAEIALGKTLFFERDCRPVTPCPARRAIVPTRASLTVSAFRSVLPARRSSDTRRISTTSRGAAPCSGMGGPRRWRNRQWRRSATPRRWVCQATRRRRSCARFPVTRRRSAKSFGKSGVYDVEHRARVVRIRADDGLEGFPGRSRMPMATRPRSVRRRRSRPDALLRPRHVLDLSRRRQLHRRSRSTTPA